MTSLLDVLPYAVTAWIAVVGLWGVMTSRNLLHLVVCLGVTESSSYVLLLGIGWREHGAAPFFVSPLPGPAVDPVVQALMLTDVVIEVTVFALLIALALKVHERAKTLDPNELHVLRG